MARFSTSPRRKSASVAVCQKVGEAAPAATATAAQPSRVAAQRTKRVSMGRSILKGKCQRAGARDRQVGGDLPFAEHGALKRPEAAAAAIGFHDGQNRGGQRRQRFAL